MQRVAPTDFARAPTQFQDEPIVVEEALSTKECDDWMQHMFQKSPQEMVLVQKGAGEKMMHAKMPLEEAIEEVLTKSSHWDPIRLTSIGAKACSTDQVPFQDLVNGLYKNNKDKKDKDSSTSSDLATTDNEEKEDTLDWFDCFAKHIPVHDTLVVAGDGAPSPTVQCHPYTKYHLCIDGSQLIRLVPPLPYRANPVLEHAATPIVQEAWDGFPMSLGCQTRLSQNLNMFAHRHRDVDHSVEDPSLRELKAGTNLYEQFQHWSEDPSMFHANFFLPAEHPKQPKLHHDLFHSTVLITGDMVVIPPGWWYQTYHLEPSVSLHTQRCRGTATATQFIDHIIQASGMDFHFDDDKERHTKEEAQSIVDTLFELLEEHYDAEDEQGLDRHHDHKRYHDVDVNSHYDDFLDDNHMFE